MTVLGLNHTSLFRQIPCSKVLNRNNPPNPRGDPPTPHPPGPSPGTGFRGPRILVQRTGSSFIRFQGSLQFDQTESGSRTVWADLGVIWQARSGGLSGVWVSGPVGSAKRRGRSKNCPRQLLLDWSIMKDRERFCCEDIQDIRFR